MEPQIHIHVHVEAKSSAQWKAENFKRNMANWNRQINDGIQRHIIKEQAAGNPRFMNINTHDEYLAAIDAEAKHQRKTQGFWKYYFGN